MAALSGIAGMSPAAAQTAEPAVRLGAAASHGDGRTSPATHLVSRLVLTVAAGGALLVARRALRQRADRPEA
jgi:hypothetical protein